MRKSRSLALAAILALASTSAWAVGSLSKGLCHKSETTYFSCQTSKQRRIALCGSPPKTLQYRFGREDHPEFVFPQNASEGLEKFLFAHYARYRADRIEIRFSNRDVDYTIFSYLENGSHNAGVHVTTPEGKEHEFICEDKVTLRLIELKEVLSCDAESALTAGNCPP
ncbi:MAG TPA: hypothetical protein VJ734_06940 [Nitrosospira sp.]|nr:hypothetical protein [Nitrosospira sp.]